MYDIFIHGDYIRIKRLQNMREKARLPLICSRLTSDSCVTCYKRGQERASETELRNHINGQVNVGLGGMKSGREITDTDS